MNTEEQLVAKRTGWRLKEKFWSTRGRRVLTVAVLVFVVYSVVGFLVLPAILKWQLPKQLSETTRRDTTVRQVRVNPWALSVRVRGLEMREAGGAVFAGWDDFYANFQASSIFRRAWTFKEILLAEPVGLVVLKENGEFNFSDLLNRTNAPPEDDSGGGIPGVQVFLLNVTNGTFRFEDRTFAEPFQAEYRDINLRLTDLTTRQDAGTPYSFHAESAGKTLKWTGQITVQPFSSRGLIEMENAAPARYQPYLDSRANARVTEGRLTVRSDYFVSAGTNGFDAMVTNAFVQLAGFKVEDPERGEVVFSLGEFTIEGARANLRERRAGVEKLTLDGPEVRARLEEDGQLNLAQLAARPETNSVAITSSDPGTNSFPPWIFELDSFTLTNGAVHFEDRTRSSGFATRLQPITVTMEDFSTAADANASYQFAMTTEVAEQLSGAGRVSVTPVRSNGEFSIAALQLPKYRPYYEEALKGELSSGELSLKVNYEAEQNDGFAASISNLVVTLVGLSLKAPGSEETVVSIPEFAVEGGNGNLQERSARIARVRSSDGSILLRRESDGAINLLSFLAPGATNEVAEVESEKETAGAWQAVVDEIAIQGYAVRFEDRQVPQAATVNVDQIGLRIAGAGTDLEKSVEVELGLRLNESGLLSVEGTTVVSPMLADLRLTLTNVDLRMIQPYLQEHLNVSITNGTAAVAARVQYASGSTNEDQVKFVGDVFVDDLATLNLVDSHGLVSWTNLAVTGIEFEQAPRKLLVDEVHWNGLMASVMIDSNGQMNVKTILPGTTNDTAVVEAENVETSEGETVAPFPMQVKRFTLTNSAIVFTDQSLVPPVEVPIGKMAGTITGLSSDPQTMADVEINAEIGEQAPLHIAGEINPLAGAPEIDLAITNRNLQLPPLTGYMEKFTGFPLAQGRLTLGLEYEVRNNELKAQNHVQIDRLTLGRQLSGTNATKLPLKLAVALLKDSNGQIALDVPLAGRLNDPEFRIGPALGQVTGNLITKAVASPFKLLGAAVGGGEELSYIEFRPGTAEFTEESGEKIAKLGRALEGREGLNLEIEASIDPDLDRTAIARAVVQDQMKELRLQELKEFGMAPDSAEAFELEPAELRRLLRGEVSKQIGTNLAPALEEMALASTEAISGAADAAPREKWYKRFVNIFRSKDSPEAAARRRAKADAELMEQNPQLAGLTEETMERLLAAHIEVPPERLVELMKARIDAVRAELLKTGTLTEDRLFFIPPRAPQEGYTGQARANLSLN